MLVADITDGADLHLDVRSDDDWAAARDWVEEHWGGLDVLVNNAGVAGGGRIDVAGMDEWQWITEINLFGVVRGTRTFVPMFKQQRRATSSTSPRWRGWCTRRGWAPTTRSRPGWSRSARPARTSWPEWDIHCSAVCPCYFRTKLIENMQGTDTAVGQVIGGLVAAAPLGPEDIAAAVLEGMDRGDELILPDPAASAAYELKLTDRASYDQVMRKQAARLNAVGQEHSSEPDRRSSRGPRRGPVRRRRRPRVAGQAGHRARATRSRCSSSAAAPPT